MLQHFHKVFGSLGYRQVFVVGYYHLSGRKCFGQLLRDSDFKGDATYDKVISLAKTSLDNDEKGYRREFIRLAETAEGLAKD